MLVKINYDNALYFRTSLFGVSSKVGDRIRGQLEGSDTEATWRLPFQ